MQPLVTFLENRAYEAIAHDATLATKARRPDRTVARRHTRTPPAKRALPNNFALPPRPKPKPSTLAADVATLFDWLRRDILSLGRSRSQTRCELYDFVVAELRARQSLCPHRIGPVVRALTNQGDDLLAFAAQLDQDLAGLADRFQLPVATVREVFNNEVLDEDRPERWTRDAVLRERLGSRFYAVSVAVAEVADAEPVPVP